VARAQAMGRDMAYMARLSSPPDEAAAKVDEYKQMISRRQRCQEHSSSKLFHGIPEYLKPFDLSAPAWNPDDVTGLFRNPKQDVNFDNAYPSGRQSLRRKLGTWAVGAIGAIKNNLGRCPIIVDRALKR